MAVKENKPGRACMNPAAIDKERLLLETLFQAPHPNMIVVYGVMTEVSDQLDAGNVCLVMEYCAYGSLESYLKKIRESGEVGAPGSSGLS